MSQDPPPLPPPLPSSGYVPPPAYEPGVGRFNFEEAMRRGWETLSATYMSSLGAVSLMTLLWVVGNVTGLVIPGAGSLAGLFLAPVFVGLGFSFVLRVRGARPGGAEFFDGLKGRYWSLFVIELLKSLMGFVAAVPMIVLIVAAVLVGQGARSGGLAIGLAVMAVLAGMLPVLYVAARLSFAGLLFMDAPVGSLELFGALRMSWARTKPHAWGLVWLSVVLGLVNVLCAVLLVMPVLLLGMPLTLAVTAAAYDMICPPRFTGRCLRCGYDCRSVVGGVCPECGAALA
ncbi:MAG: hypothetical protein SFZ24_06180 [Planctomycetota bacterium]|nr:hypothetical protein [Planctomycetota bacterium]